MTTFYSNAFMSALFISPLAILVAFLAAFHSKRFILSPTPPIVRGRQSFGRQSLGRQFFGR